MKCPCCSDAELVTTERSGVEIDLCPRCRGVWLDRGELDKIVSRSARAAGDDDEGFDDDHRGWDDADRGGRGSPRRPWWAGLFD